MSLMVLFFTSAVKSAVFPAGIKYTVAESRALPLTISDCIIYARP